MILMMIGWGSYWSPFWIGIRQGVLNSGSHYVYYPARSKINELMLKDVVKDRKEALTRMQIDLINKAIKEKPDVILFFKGDNISVNTIRILKTHCKLLGMWTYDDPLFINASAGGREKAKLCDFALTCCQSSIELYKRLGVKDARLFYPGCTPEHHYDMCKNVRKRDIKYFGGTEKYKAYFRATLAFAGLVNSIGNPSRVDMVKNLIRISEKYKMSLKIWTFPGQGKQGMERYAMNYSPEAYISRVFSNTLININMSRIPNDVPADLYSDAKNFQILGSGAFALLFKEHNLQTIFKDGKEVVFWDSFKDLENKIVYYYHHPKERQTIADEGQKAAYDRFSLPKNIKKLCQDWQKELNV